VGPELPGRGVVAELMEPDWYPGVSLRVGSGCEGGLYRCPVSLFVNIPLPTQKGSDFQWTVIIVGLSGEHDRSRLKFDMAGREGRVTSQKSWQTDMASPQDLSRRLLQDILFVMFLDVHRPVTYKFKSPSQRAGMLRERQCRSKCC
jgi:hypothetical protein